MALSLLSCFPPLLQAFPHPREELLRGFNFCCSHNPQKYHQCALEQSRRPQSAGAELLRGHQYGTGGAGAARTTERVFMRSTCQAPLTTSQLSCCKEQYTLPCLIDGGF